jgi:hypothetical protein
MEFNIAWVRLRSANVMAVSPDMVWAVPLQDKQGPGSPKPVNTVAAELASMMQRLISPAR